eukprot:scaffold98471_cov27-Prasinocladus_malaysianus.AAC.1
MSRRKAQKTAVGDWGGWGPIMIRPQLAGWLPGDGQGTREPAPPSISLQMFPMTRRHYIYFTCSACLP